MVDEKPDSATLSGFLRIDIPPHLLDWSFSITTRLYCVSILAAWKGGEAHPQTEWAWTCWMALSPFSSSGVSVNFLGDEGKRRYGLRTEPTTSGWLHSRARILLCVSATSVLKKVFFRPYPGLTTASLDVLARRTVCPTLRKYTARRMAKAGMMTHSGTPSGGYRRHRRERPAPPPAPSASTASESTCRVASRQRPVLRRTAPRP